MTTHEAKKLLRDELDRRELPYDKLSARTIGFSDLARTDMVFVTVHGWEPNPVATELNQFASDHGFRVSYQGPGIAVS